MQKPPDGVHERLITERLWSALESLGSSRRVDRWALDGADAHQKLARHVAAEVARVLADLPSKDRPQNQVAVANNLLRYLAEQLPKSGASFSPTTRYRDYAISPTRFHWETQGRARVDSPTGRRYLDSPHNGWSFYLFVRESPDRPYAYAGPATYTTHSGDRPIAITWTLEYSLSGGLFDRCATLAAQQQAGRGSGER